MNNWEVLMLFYNVPESICVFIPVEGSYLSLGTDGFGRSDTRMALRSYFQVDAASIVNATMHLLK